MKNYRWRQLDYRGVCAVILALGTVIALNLLVRADGSGSSLDTTLMATIFGGLIGCLGSYLGSAFPQRRKDDRDETIEDEI